MTKPNRKREQFRLQVAKRDGGMCKVPWCDEHVSPDPSKPGDQHHIIERNLWDDGGWFPDNGVNVCPEHHQLAEEDEIPPQAFWLWAGVDAPQVPACVESQAVDKWGKPFETPPHESLRDYHKYPSTRHLMPCYWQSARSAAHTRTEHDDTELTSVDSFTGIELVVLVKMDGSNAMLVADSDEPVRARNGRDAEHRSFDRLKQAYWDRGVYETLDERYQVFGEHMTAKHSIHYGTEAPPADDVFQVFGVFDSRLNVWLSWDSVEAIADQIGFETVPVVGHYTFDGPNAAHEFTQQITTISESVIDQGHEGTVVRSRYPFHYGQFPEKVGKFVRPNHVQTDEHWSEGTLIENQINSQTDSFK